MPAVLPQPGAHREDPIKARLALLSMLLQYRRQSERQSRRLSFLKYLLTPTLSHTYTTPHPTLTFTSNIPRTNRTAGQPVPAMLPQPGARREDPIKGALALLDMLLQYLDEEAAGTSGSAGVSVGTAAVETQTPAASATQKGVYYLPPASNTLMRNTSFCRKFRLIMVCASSPMPDPILACPCSFGAFVERHLSG